jgi:hypothetical protein
MHIPHLTAVILLHSQNTVGVCKLITLMMLNQVSSGLVTPLKYIYAITQVSNINFAVCFQCINLKEVINEHGVMRWRSWLRHCSTSKKFAGCVNGTFH